MRADPAPDPLDVRGLEVVLPSGAGVGPVDLALAPGEEVLLLGPSGAGKSTLLHVAGLLERPDGSTAAIWMDGSMDCWQVCSADHIDGYERFGLAAEPMSCYADAFNSGDRLVHLGPGESHEVRWGATLR